MASVHAALNRDIQHVSGRVREKGNVRILVVKVLQCTTEVKEKILQALGSQKHLRFSCLSASIWPPLTGPSLIGF